MDFRLLVKRPASSGSPSITVDREKWYLTDSLDIHSDGIPEYACVSYVWGASRDDNPIHPGILMSGRTVIVLRAAIRNSTYQAFWIDAFCIPSDPARKGPTLESMGYIYGRATTVIAVLVPKSFAAVKQMSHLQRGGTPSQQLLDDLEQEPWIKSVWTYQEVVNNNNLFFVGEDTTDSNILEGADFLNVLGYAMTKYREATGISVFDLRRRYPNLDTFEDLILDWFLAAFAERAALEIMANMCRRHYDDPRNYFYSMIGALTQKPSERSKGASVESLAETFMAIAEEKGDYSFIFSSAPRDERPGLEWRPRPQLLHAIFAWHVDGEKLSGIKEANGIRLHDIIVMHPGETVGPVARRHVCTWMEALELEHGPEGPIVAKLRGILELLGFTGKGPCILTEHGFAFLQEELPAGATVEIWTSPNVHYVVGSPAMAVARIGNTVRYVPAVFAGSVRELEGRTEVFIPTNAARL